MDHVLTRAAARDHWLRHLALQLGVAIALIAVAQLGSLFVLPRANVALVWPAAGVALAVAYRLGLIYLIGVAAGAFVAHFMTTGAFLPAVAVTAGNVVGAYLGAMALRRGRVDGAGSQVPDVLWMTGAVVVAATVTSLVGSTVMYLSGLARWEGFASLWWICWVADTVGALLLLPVLLSWFDPSRGVERLARRRESLIVLMATAAVSWIIYADILPAGLAMARPLSYLVFPLFIWAAVRLGMRQVTLLLLVHGVITFYYTAGDGGPFSTGILSESVLSLHSHLAVLSVSILLLAATTVERNVKEAALREREARYRLLVENQTDFLLKTDREGRILFASPSLCQLLGRSEQSLLGASAQTVLFPDPAVAKEAWRSLMKPPHACYLEQPLAAASEQRWIGWAAKSVVEQGEVCAVVAVGRDISERRAAEKKAREHLQALAHVGRVGAMGELASGLAHELNQPLCAITTFSQACQRLLGPDADPDLHNAIERVVANATRAGQIIRQMRTFVRKDDPSMENVNINRLVEEVVDLTRSDANHHGARIELDLAADLPAVRAAPVQVQQVLVNLIRNAVDAMASSGTADPALMIRTRRSRDGCIEVCVADDGPGLPAGLMNQVFEPFTTTKPGGMGLGLSISRSIIETHGGNLQGRNRVDGGAEFCFSLEPAQRLEGPNDV